jgi:two-component system, chemotaxis family, sensor kinase CheA
VKDRIELGEFVSGFVAEADEHLRVARTRLNDIEQAQSQGRAHPRAVRDLFRALHTLKGLSAMVGAAPIEELTHAMESILRTAESAGGRLPTMASQPLIAGLRVVEEGVRALAEGQTPSPAPGDLLDDLARAGASAPSPMIAAAQIGIDPELWSKLSLAEREEVGRGVADGRRLFRVEFVPSPEQAGRGRTITTVREAVSRLGDVVKVIPVSVPRTPTAPGGLVFVMLLLCDVPPEVVADAAGLSAECVTPVSQTTGAAALSELPPLTVIDEPWRGRAVRVDVDRLDDALERLASIVVTRFRLERVLSTLAASGADVRELRHVLADNARQLRDLRSAVLRLRLVPVAEMLEPLPLVARGLAATMAKPVELVIERSSAELDKGVADRLFPALIHLVRNAVDHGIEPPEERRLLGKPEQGTVRVGCSELAGARLELRVSDDGRGVDAVRVSQAAARALPRSESELLEILAQPGFTTKPQASRTSGRGMGVDIVRRVVVDELGGELSVETEPGEGTTFVLRVPLTVTIIDAFTFEAGEQRFAAPVAMVEEIIEVDAAQMRSAPEHQKLAGGGVGLLERRGRALPLLELATLFALGDSARRGPKALVVQRDEHSLAFGVDRMLGRQEVVVRPLEDPLVRVRGISGSTDLGDGRPTLVLDLWALSRRWTAGAEARA